MRFPVVLHTDDGTRYGVTVPDLPGCFSGGATFDAAMGSAAEAIDLHLEGLTEDGHDVPTPRPIDHHQKNPDYVGGVWALVEVDVSRFDAAGVKIHQPEAGGTSTTPSAHIRRFLLGIGSALSAFGSAPPYRYPRAGDRARDLLTLGADMRAVCGDMKKTPAGRTKKRKPSTDCP